MGVKQPNSLRVIIDLETEAEGEYLAYKIIGVTVDGKKIEGHESYVIFADSDNCFRIDLVGGTY